ncbi:MAG: hypothetical protein NVV74_21095 [Magnetospirillum sp.]|nr:hypothetical protein [Magnetospirillum sp.]
MLKTLAVALSLAAPLVALSAASPSLAADKKPPACAAVSFRPLANTANDGEMTAGHYKSRFATIDVIGKVEGGRDSYHLRVNNQPVKPVSEVPKSSYGCLNSKHVKTPPQAIGGTCTGSRLRVVVDSATKQKLFMLFALQGDDWKLCESGTIG